MIFMYSNLYMYMIILSCWSLKFENILFYFLYFRAASAAYEDSQARGLIGAVATGLRQSHSNAGSEPHLQPTPPLTATLDP